MYEYGWQPTLTFMSQATDIDLDIEESQDEEEDGDAANDEEEEKAEVLPAVDTDQGVHKRRERRHVRLVCTDEECEYQHADTLETERLDLLYNSMSPVDQKHFSVYHRWS